MGWGDGDGDGDGDAMVRWGYDGDIGEMVV